MATQCSPGSHDAFGIYNVSTGHGNANEDTLNDKTLEANKAWDELSELNKPSQTSKTFLLLSLMMLLAIVFVGMNLKVMSALPWQNFLLPWQNFLIAMPADVVSGVIFSAAAALGTLIIDKRALYRMFFDLRILEKAPKQHVLAGILGRSVGTRTVVAYVVTLNWVAAVGVGSCFARMSFANPIQNYSSVEAPKPDVLYKVLSGDLELNSLVRSGSHQFWESYYGNVCCIYLMGSFIVHAAETANFKFERLVRKACVYMTAAIMFAAFGGYFNEDSRFICGVIIILHGILPWVLKQLQHNASATSGSYPSTAPDSNFVFERILLVISNLSIVSALVMSWIKSLPGATDSDRTASQHVDATNGVHLQFCEEPYRFTSWASQGASFFFHMPYLPALVLLTQRQRLTADLWCLLALQVALQCWTGYGHYLADPRVCRITEGSILLACMWLLQFLKSTSDIPTWLDQRTVAVCHILFSCTIYTFFGLLTFILVTTAVVPVIGLMCRDLLQLGSLVPLKKKLEGLLLFGMTFSIIIVEGTFCKSLLEIYPFPYHAVFDFCFFQVASTFLWFTACNAQEAGRTKSE